MAKRASIRLTGSNPILRISRPGVDVDSASEHDFLLHESFLYGQPFWRDFIPCPFAGYTGIDEREATVTRTIPNTGTVPFVTSFLVDDTAAINFPAPTSQGVGSNSGGYPITDWWLFHNITATTLTVTFLKGHLSLRSPNGAYITLTRHPNA